MTKTSDIIFHRHFSAIFIAISGIYRRFITDFRFYHRFIAVLPPFFKFIAVQNFLL